MLMIWSIKLRGSAQVYLAIAALGLMLSGCGGSAGSAGAVGAQAVGGKIALPPPGKLYHNVYPGGTSGEEVIAEADLLAYQNTVGQKVAWVTLNNNWYNSSAFPTATCTWIRSLGSVPLVRLGLRSTWEVPEPVYTMAAIAAGHFDTQLRHWAEQAKTFGTPVIVEYGTEVNDDWFPWNGEYAGGGTLTGSPPKAKGPAAFVAAYRHIVTVMRGTGATNLSWAFHVGQSDYPSVAWNRLENYYPGSDVVDWVGSSLYCYTDPTQNYAPVSLRTALDSVYPRLVKIAPGKPITLLEMGTTAGSALLAPQTWAQAGLNDLFSNRWPQVRGFSWWNERFQNGDGAWADMRVQDLPALATVFRSTLAAHKAQLQTRPVYSN
jgi:hypothetical protein